MIMVLLSALVKRFSVSHMRDFKVSFYIAIFSIGLNTKAFNDFTQGKITMALHFLEGEIQTSPK